jgi:hypothetical protein
MVAFHLPSLLQIINFNLMNTAPRLFRFPASITTSITVMLLTTSIVGCGPSQEDLMRRAAMRPRDLSEEDSATDNSESPPPATEIVPATATRTDTNTPTSDSINNSSGAGGPMAVQATTPIAGDVAAVNPSSGDSAPGGQVESPNQPASIASRKPPEPLTEDQRRVRAAENIKAIAAGLNAYVQRNGHLPARGMKAGNGAITLSWRVELLPYLGYENLYRRFNVNQPWDSPQNLPLMDLIPDCYVSPERFDTYTNYLGLEGRNYLFQDDVVPLRNIEDGVENTLAILEVNDALAVPWTSPSDYAPEFGKADKGIGELRPGGTYGIWANGWTTLLKKGIGAGQLHNAFTYESLDGLRAGDIHNALVVREASVNTNNNSVADSTPPGDRAAASVAKSPSSVGETSSGDGDRFADVVGEPLPKMPVPERAAVAAAKDRVENLFQDRLRTVSNQKTLQTLATDLLSAAKTMREDPAGAFALQIKAIETAAKGGDLRQLRTAINDHVAMFEVDPVSVASDALQSFGSEYGGALAEMVNGREYLKMALPVVFGAVLNDSYDDPQELVQLAIMYEGKTGNREFLPDLNRLRQQLSASRNFLRRTEIALATLRSDPRDPAANYAAGRYIAFIKGDWDQGLPLLAAGDNDRLAQMAKADLATGDSGAQQMLSTADAWRDLGEETSNELFRGACRQRAAYWYEAAMQSLPDSLAKLHAKTRWDESVRTTAGSPISLLLALGQDLGIDLPQALAELKSPHLQTRRLRDNNG